MGSGLTQLGILSQSPVEVFEPYTTPGSQAPPCGFNSTKKPGIMDGSKSQDRGERGFFEVHRYLFLFVSRPPVSGSAAERSR